MNIKYICLLLIMTFLQQQKSYLRDLSKIYQAVLFIEVFADALTLIFGMFCLLIVFHRFFYNNVSILTVISQQTWYPLYVLMVAVVIKLFGACLLGTIVEIAVRGMQQH